MRRFALCWLLWSMLVATPGAAAPVYAQDASSAGFTRLARRLRRSVVTIATPDGSASGFLVGDARWVVTNHHVIEDAGPSIDIGFASGTHRHAQLRIDDPDHDLALLEIDGASPGTPLDLLDSDTLHVGQRVLAMGAPHGLEWTLTAGVVSARRDQRAAGGPRIARTIQTDAVAGPGSSGGPLVDARGRVVGVIFCGRRDSAGVQFAIPANCVRDLVARAHAELGPPSSRGVTSAALGITGRDVASRTVAGVLVLHVEPGSAAAAAGLAGSRDGPPPGVSPGAWSGHVITAIDGHTVHTVAELDARLGGYPRGTTLRLSTRIETSPVGAELSVTLPPGP